eukprot:1161696-Pelagomonas_calceolata.AAC.9
MAQRQLDFYSIMFVSALENRLRVLKQGNMEQSLKAVKTVCSSVIEIPLQKKGSIGGLAGSGWAKTSGGICSDFKPNVDQAWSITAGAMCQDEESC